MPEETKHLDHDHEHQADHDHPLHHDHEQEHSHDDGRHPDHDDDDHDHDHSHDHGDGHTHDHGPGIIDWFQTVFHWHGHSHQQSELAADQALLDNKEGIRVLWISLGALLLTSVLQIFIVWLSSSMALLADTMHNIGDGLNSIPLLIALYLAQRVATRRYTYGFGKAEDVLAFSLSSLLPSARLSSFGNPSRSSSITNR